MHRDSINQKDYGKNLHLVYHHKECCTECPKFPYIFFPSCELHSERLTEWYDLPLTGSDTCSLCPFVTSYRCVALLSSHIPLTIKIFIINERQPHCHFHSHIRVFLVCHIELLLIKGNMKIWITYLYVKNGTSQFLPVFIIRLPIFPTLP